ncbi:MAG: hypothetical protein M3R24_33235 [Chloroflexota bacterium]|nr:hypothetical protein [Chloroflexota bacterium]
MEQADVHYGQRIRVNLPGVGDHGQVGTVRKVRGNLCSIHLDWDRRPQHVVVVYAADLDRLLDEPLMGSRVGVREAAC